MLLSQNRRTEELNNRGTGERGLRPSDVSRLRYDSFVDEIVFQVETSEESGVLVASWDAPAGQGGITTQGRDLRELQDQVTDAVRCHFDAPDAIHRVRLIELFG